MKTGKSAVIQKKVNNIPKNVSAIIFSPYYKKSKVISINSKATIKVIKNASV